MKVDILMTKKDVENMQRPEGILAQARSIGAPSEKRVKENIASLQKRVKASRDWLALKRRGIEKAKVMLSQMEKRLFSRT
jgi:hypothetical protein